MVRFLRILPNAGCESMTALGNLLVCSLLNDIKKQTRPQKTVTSTTTVHEIFNPFDYVLKGPCLHSRTDYVNINKLSVLGIFGVWKRILSKMYCICPYANCDL